jgi:multidrug efflux system membrane fusion protein
MNARWRFGLLAILIVAIVAVWWVRRGPSGRKTDADDAVSVVVAVVRQGAFAAYQSQPGTVAPANSVTVRSQVDGVLKSVAVSGGQTVKQGELLAEVDARPFEAQRQLAAGDLARSQSQLANAQEILKRYETLLAQDSIARQRVADQQALVRQYAADVKSAQGRIDTANLQVGNARITSPISGTVGLRRVDPGNLVGPGDARGIVVVNQSQPSKVVFSLPVDPATRLLARMRVGACIPVVAYGNASGDPIGNGRLLAVNNQVDPGTGTVKFEAEFPNADGALLPNRFVTVKLPSELQPNATLVPTAAIQQGANGAYVYVVKDDKAAVQSITVGDGDSNTTVVRSGLTAGTRVVVAGADRLRSGTVVRATTSSDASPAYEEPTCTADQAHASGRGSSGTL